MKKIDHMNLEQLEKDIWAEPTYASHLVTTCHRLRKKSLRDFTIEDLRIMIGQDIGSKHLLPKAIEILRENPLAAGDFYDGDLLMSVATLSTNSLPTDKQSNEALVNVCHAALSSTTSEFSKKQKAAIEGLLGKL